MRFGEAVSEPDTLTQTHMLDRSGLIRVREFQPAVLAKSDEPGTHFINPQLIRLSWSGGKFSPCVLPTQELEIKVVSS